MEKFFWKLLFWQTFFKNFEVKHYFGHFSRMVGPINVKRKGSALVWYWVQYVTLTFDLTHEIALSQEYMILRRFMTLPFDHAHDLDLGVSRSESEIALSQEWGGRLTWNEKDLSHPFMTMILTSVTMVGWADVPDSDRGDFTRRRAVDVSSYILQSACAVYFVTVSLSLLRKILTFFVCYFETRERRLYEWWTISWAKTRSDKASK